MNKELRYKLQDSLKDLEDRNLMIFAGFVGEKGTGIFINI